MERLEATCGRNELVRIMFELYDSADEIEVVTYLIQRRLAPFFMPVEGHTSGMPAEQPGMALRFPRRVSFRSADKRPEDHSTVGEVLEMYQQQRVR